MTTRELGHSGLQVSPLCLGGNVFGWTADELTSFAVLDAFVDAGFNFVDTADVYSIWMPGHAGGESETIIGNWFSMSGKRDKVILATKFAKEMGPGKSGLSKAYMMRAVEDSLRRLRTDYIDLYQSHDDDSNTSQEDTAAAFASLIEQGKVRAIGASNFTRDRLASALKLDPRYECLQPNYNLMDRADYEANLEPLCLEAGIAVIPYFSLASGFLTGKYRSAADTAGKARGSRVEKYLDERGHRVLAALDEVAAAHDSTPARVSLAWLMARPSITAPIASATSVAQVQDLLLSASLDLDAASIEKLNQASS